METSHLALPSSQPWGTGAPGLKQCRKEREEEKKGGCSIMETMSVLGGGLNPRPCGPQTQVMTTVTAPRTQSWAGGRQPCLGEQHPLSLCTGGSVRNALLGPSCVKLPSIKAGFPLSVQLGAQVCKAKENPRGHRSYSNNIEHQVLAEVSGPRTAQLRGRHPHWAP